MNERVPFEGQNLESSLSEPDYSGEAEADFALRQEELEQAMKEGTTPNESQEDIDADKKRMPNLFDSEGKLRDGMPPEEEFNPDAEAEHMRRIMTSRQVPMRDAWDILKFGYPSVAGVEIPEEVRARHNVVASNCKVCQGKLEEVHPGEGKMVCMNANCPAQMMIQSEGQPPRLRFPAEMFPTGGFNSLEEMTENARNNPDYSQDLGY